MNNFILTGYLEDRGQMKTIYILPIGSGLNERKCFIEIAMQNMLRAIKDMKLLGATIPNDIEKNIRLSIIISVLKLLNQCVILISFQRKSFTVSCFPVKNNLQRFICSVICHFHFLYPDIIFGIYPH